jgi:hypothetical protein
MPNSYSIEETPLAPSDGRGASIENATPHPPQ